MQILVFSVMYFAFPILIVLTYCACSEIKRGDKKVKKQLYYVVKSSNNSYVFHKQEEAVKKQGALLRALREPISIQVMEQMSLEEYLKETTKKVTING